MEWRQEENVTDSEGLAPSCGTFYSLDLFGPFLRAKSDGAVSDIE